MNACDGPDLQADLYTNLHADAGVDMYSDLTKLGDDQADKDKGDDIEDEMAALRLAPWTLIVHG